MAGTTDIGEARATLGEVGSCLELRLGGTWQVTSARPAWRALLGVPPALDEAEESSFISAVAASVAVPNARVVLRDAARTRAELEEERLAHALTKAALAAEREARVAGAPLLQPTNIFNVQQLVYHGAPDGPAPLFLTAQQALTNKKGEEE